MRRPLLLSIVMVLFLVLAQLPTSAQNAAGTDPIPPLAELSRWNQCREYLPVDSAKPCRIDFDMAQTKDGKNPPQTHKDIAIHLSPKTSAVVVLWHSSPFAVCSLATSPGPLARDLSSNISGSLTSMAGLGQIPEASATDTSLGEYAQAPLEVHGLEASHVESPLQKDEEEIIKALKELADTAAPYNSLKRATVDINAIRKNVSASYLDDPAAEHHIKAALTAASDFVSLSLPDAKTPPLLTAKLAAVEAAIAKLRNTYPEDEIRDFLSKVGPQIDKLKIIQRPEVAVVVIYLNDAIPKVQKLIDFIYDWRAKKDRRATAKELADASVQALPIALYSESKVGVTVKCTDAINGNALFDSIQFNAYFQNPPIFDISTGVIVSALHGRQVTTQTPPSDPATSSCPVVAPATTSDCPTVVIHRSRPQFMPGVFAEIHLHNFKLPWVHDPADVPSDPPHSIPTWMSDNAPRHALGYVGSFGLAGGFMVNPNSGSVQAEFFEGVSFGIQRFVILVGNHNGRSQNLTNGWYQNAPVAPGTTPTTVNNWANGLALGITYRVPLR